MSYIGREPQIGNFQVCDAISVVNGQAAYTMQVDSVNVLPETVNHCLVSLNGILQSPTTSFTISGATITFASNLVTGDVIDFIQILGSVLDLGVPSDDTVSIAKLTATGTKDSTTFLRGDNTFAAPSGGKVLQVVSAIIDQSFTNSSASFIEVTDHNLSITPSATSSKVLVFMNFNTRSSGMIEQFYTIYRSTTNVGSTNGLGATHDDDGGSDTEVQFALQVLDSPSSTSAVNYHLRSKSNGSATARVNNKGSDSVITLMEIGA